jgi:membrane-anchored protein YejM (alkaline phosphatase superfamily)
MSKLIYKEDKMIYPTKQLIAKTGSILKKIAFFIKDKWLEQKYLFTLAQCVTAAFIIGYFFYAPFPKTFWGFIYIISIFGYYGICVLLAYIILFPFSLNRFTRILIPILTWIWFLFLTVDLVIFDIFKNHMNMFLVEMIFLDFKGIGIPTIITIISSVVFVFILVFLIFFQIKTTKRTSKNPKNKLFLITTCLIPLLLFGMNSLIHIEAYNRQIETITIYDYYPPIYAPMRKSVKGSFQYSGIDEDNEFIETVSDSISKHVLKYPLVSPVFGDNIKSKKTILLLLLESWRADTVTPDIMPNIYNFSQKSTIFNKHISGSNTTHCGLFTLFYGVNCGIHTIVKNNPYSYRSIFTKSLFENGYKLNIYTLNTLRRRHEKTMFFDDAKIENIHNSGTAKDLSDHLINDIMNNDPDELNFYFIFLYPSHYPYAADPKYKIYPDVPDRAGVGVVFSNDSEIKEIKKIYLNSLYYEDYLLGNVLNALEEKGIMDDVWVIISGDHAEEFNDVGTLVVGHGQALNKFQTNVPMIIKKPGQTNKEEINYISLHQDIVPTLMEEILKIEISSYNYSNGTNMFKLTKDRGTSVSSFFDVAYIFDNITYEVNTTKKYYWDTGLPIERSLTNDEKLKIKELFEDEMKFINKD